MDDKLIKDFETSEKRVDEYINKLISNTVCKTYSNFVITFPLKTI